MSTIYYKNRISCDKRWTVEALGNIIKNASEHDPVGQAIKVEVGANPISTWIRVTDAGKGLDRKEIEKIFKRFVISDDSKG